MGSRSLKSSPFERAVLAVLKERLQSLDLTIDRLAERAGITRARCYKIFAGDTVCTMSDFGFIVAGTATLTSLSVISMRPASATRP